ncbi:hypothetical protein ElyMa_001556100 [Elysia marginata]|uniref:Uncharacterized protein n=1 Tax=Elysia marginata TaxID=1093978 RepID=A0AAV4JAR6_9GAST|nr:hypothetical protein ElyMa_001556100 [Elysia marginata]
MQDRRATHFIHGNYKLQKIFRKRQYIHKKTTIAADRDSQRNCSRNIKTITTHTTDIASNFNSIHSPLLDIPLDRVTPPYLHCLLGITKRHHTLLEDAADEIDRLLYTDDVTKTDEMELFKKYGVGTELGEGQVMGSQGHCDQPTEN